MEVPARLAQRMFLLAYNPDKGRVAIGSHLGALLRAAALADLYVTGHLADERGRAVVTRHPCHDPVLLPLLEEIAASRPRKWQVWVGRRQRHLIRETRRQLGDGGWVRLEPYKILGLFPATRVTVRDPRVRKELIGRVTGALKKPIDRVDPADAALVAIVAAGDLKIVLDRQRRRANKRRLRELTALSGPIGPALRRAIEEASSAGG
ncbi:GPP34 family phosphoprotein [Actinoplanes sp. NBRC 103695]|uniref:GOLPH3/VPS74 family protein n=1 Tax=Actinoplanes sp. NBRC 103695 TaxID=3032202 RepID=UPI0024A1E9AD|nr:GPP34 family phosphoprotein [Actinoplanes sp. NBRC 103695]GLY92829.1 hypothetical protein Acsp02_00850 [Actinoplanes sp. NBRC 103695]